MKLQFSPFAPSPPWETISIRDALGQIFLAIYESTVVAGHSISDMDAPAIARANDSLAEVALAALREDRLPAYCHLIGDATFYRIPHEYWRDTMADLTLTGELFSFPSDAKVPPALDGAPVVLFTSDLASFLEELRVERRKLVAPVHRPRLPAAIFDEWADGLTDAEKNLSLVELRDACQQAFPRYQVSRDRIRERFGGQKRGPRRSAAK